MRSLYLRIWVTVVAVLALFAGVSTLLWQRHLDQERVRIEASISDRLAPWIELLERSLPRADAPDEDQAQALRDWSHRLRVPMALDDAQGRRIATSEVFARRLAEQPAATPRSIRLEDGRTLQLMLHLPRPPRDLPFNGPRPGDLPGGPGGPGGRGGPGGPGGPGAGPGGPGGLGGLGGPGGPPPELRGDGPPDRDRERGPGGPRLSPALAWMTLGGLPPGVGLALLMGALFVAVAAGAYPVVRRLTRRLEALKRGVETFGAGQLGHRVDATGSDEVAAVAHSFNRAAERLEALVRSHQSLLANASHELRSPLARLKMAVAMFADAAPERRDALRREIDTDVAELDALVEEVLLASRLDAASGEAVREPVDLLGVAAEEAVRVGAQAEGDAAPVLGDERLLRRALRNLLENARRYGGDEVVARLTLREPGRVEVQVCDRGPGVPEAYRQRIFEPFFRLPGHAEREGGVGLGLSLVRQIAERHGGSVRCEAREGGGSCFVLSLPASGTPSAGAASPTTGSR